MVVLVDLGLVYRIDDGNVVYWLEKVDVLERNKWELIIMMGFYIGVVIIVKLKFFRIIVRVSYKIKSLELLLEKLSK